MNSIVRKHFFRINFYVSLIGAMGLGHFMLWLVDLRCYGLGVFIAFVLVFLAASSKIYLIHVESGEHFWPKWMRKSN